jgi:hypothetical protein
VTELAADPQGEKLANRAFFEDVARTHGYPASRDSAHLPAKDLSPVGLEPAWRRGIEAAQQIRARERIAADRIADVQLADLAGVGVEALTEQAGTPPAPNFSLAEDSGLRKVVLRSKWVTGRRFALARLLGDSLFSESSFGERLRAATESKTYRQKFQRAFAAELLCPYDKIIEMLQGNQPTADRQEEIAHHFRVSDRIVRNQLSNHGDLEREDLAGEMESAA